MSAKLDTVRRAWLESKLTFSSTHFPWQAAPPLGRAKTAPCCPTSMASDATLGSVSSSAASQATLCVSPSSTACITLRCQSRGANACTVLLQHQTASSVSGEPSTAHTQERYATDDGQDRKYNSAVSFPISTSTNPTPQTAPQGVCPLKWVQFRQHWPPFLHIMQNAANPLRTISTRGISIFPYMRVPLSVLHERVYLHPFRKKKRAYRTLDVYPLLCVSSATVSAFLILWGHFSLLSAVVRVTTYYAACWSRRQSV